MSLKLPLGSASFAFLLAPVVAFGQPASPPAGGFKTFEEKLSYALGLNVARSLQRDGLNPDPQLFLKGFQDQLKGGEPLLTDEEVNAVFAEVQTQMRQKAEAAQKKAAADFEAAFKDENKPAGGPKSTKSGLKYEVFAQGEGPKPKATDEVQVHYIGRLPDGKVFDSSISRGEPAAFPLDGVIKGWTEGLQLMSVGSKYRLYVPAALAYGEDGRPPVIKSNQDLVFDIELLDIATAPPAGAAPAQPE